MASLISIIPELERIKKIDDFTDIVKLADFVYSIVSHGPPTYQMNISDLRGIYNDFKSQKSFGWCYANAVFMHLILRQYNRDSFIYDYGLRDERITHTVVICVLKDEKYLIDPYFSRYYADSNEIPLSFNSLLTNIRNGNKIISIYGKSKKLVKQGNDLVPMNPEIFEQSVLGGWKAECNFDNALMKKFNSVDALKLIPLKIQKGRVITKADGQCYYEFF